MRAIPLICSFLTLHSVSCSDAESKLPSEMLDTIVRLVVGSQNLDFCAYVDWLADTGWAWPWTDVGMPMLKEIAKEQDKLDLYCEQERDRSQQIFTKVGTFVKIRSRLPINCTETDANELRNLARRFEASYEGCASLSESSTWKKACMAGLFGHNTLITLLPHLSEEFWSHNKEIVLQTAFFIGNIGSLDAIIDFFDTSKDDLPNMVLELDIVFSNSGTFFMKLLKRLPNVMEKKLELVREACSLTRLDILISILEVAESVKLDELDHILDSFCRLTMFKDDPLIFYAEDKLHYVLLVAAQYGYLFMIRFLWPAMETMSNNAEAAIKKLIKTAGRKDQRSVLEFLLWESGADYMKVAHACVKVAFEGAVEGGNVNLMGWLAAKNNDDTFVYPDLGLTKLSWSTLDYAIRFNKTWEGIEYLVDLKTKGDLRFANFELVDRDNTALCMACEVGNYGLVEYLLRTTDDGKFVFPHTNPAAQDNTPLVNACLSRELPIISKLLEQDASGKYYIYRGIDPSAQSYLCIINACTVGHLDAVKWLLKMKDGEYVLPGMEDVDLTRALLTASKNDRLDIVQFLLQIKDGTYVLPGMEDVDPTQALIYAIQENRTEIVRFLFQVEDMNYVLPGMEDVDLTRALLTAIENNRLDIVQFLLQIKDGTYVLPGMEDVDPTQTLISAIRWNRMGILRFLLQVEDRNYVLPEMGNVNLTQALIFAIRLNRTETVEVLLSRALGGSYLLPGVEVTEDMLEIEGQSHEMRQILARNLEQQRI